MDIYIKNQTIFDAKYPHETQESIIFEKVPAAITTLSGMGSDSFGNTSYTSIDAIYRVIEESLPIQLGWYTVDVGQVTPVEEIQESQSLIRKILNQHRKHVIRFLLPKQQGITQKGKIILQRHQDLKEHSLYT